MIFIDGFCFVFFLATRGIWTLSKGYGCLKSTTSINHTRRNVTWHGISPGLKSKAAPWTVDLPLALPGKRVMTFSGHGYPHHMHPFPQAALYDTVEEPPQYSTLLQGSGTAKSQQTSRLVETQSKGIWTVTVNSTKFLQLTSEGLLRPSSEHADSAPLGFCGPPGHKHRWG